MSIRMRIDGMLTDMVPPARKMQGAVIARIKILSEMDISDRRLPQLNVPVSVACESSDLVGTLWAWVRFQAILPVLTKKMREEYRLTLELLDQQGTQ